MPPSFITCPSFSYYKLIWFLLFSPVSIWNIYTILALFLSLSHTHICIKQAKQNDDKPVKPNLPFAHNLMARSVIRKVSWLGTRCKISSVTRIPASKHKDIQTSGIRKDPLKAQTRENWNLLRNGKTVCNLSALSSWECYNINFTKTNNVRQWHNLGCLQHLSHRLSFTSIKCVHTEMAKWMVYNFSGF